MRPRKQFPPGSKRTSQAIRMFTGKPAHAMFAYGSPTPSGQQPKYNEKRLVTLVNSWLKFLDEHHPGNDFFATHGNTEDGAAEEATRGTVVTIRLLAPAVALLSCCGCCCCG